jgi:D-lactate dehydrogenase
VRVCVYSTKPYDTEAVVDGLKSGHIGPFATDVYEEEASLFYEDRSSEVLTADATTSIAGTTMANLDDVKAGRVRANEVTAP